MRKIIFFCFSFLLYVSFSWAVPASQNPINVSLSDGRTLTFTMHGDEFFRVSRTLDKYTILYNDNAWVYAILDDDGFLVPSHIKACNIDQRTNEESLFLNSVPHYLAYNSAQIETFQNTSRKKNYSKIGSSFPTKGSPRLLIILVEFSNNSFIYGQNQFQNLAMQENYPGSVPNSLKSGSIRDYYYDNSLGQLDIQIDVVGPFKLSRTIDFYGQNFPNGEDMNAGAMIREACNLADSEGNIDFSRYDNDNDGTVDAIHVIFAGNSEAATAIEHLIWPHRSQLIRPITIDGKKISDYSCSAELEGDSLMMDGIGTVCHEFAHILGLPDFYDTDYENSGGESFHLYRWSLMGSGAYTNGGNTPPYLTSLEKELLGWHTSTLLDTSGVYSLPVWGKGDVSYQLTTTNATEYFLLENRQKHGWDSYIDGVGMLIFHVDRTLVDKWYEGNNSINANPKHQGYYIVCADNIRSVKTFEGDPFPGNRNKTSFTDNSTPSPELWDKTAPKLNKPITGIGYTSEGNIQFQYRYNIISGTELICDTLEGLPIIDASDLSNASKYKWEISYNQNDWETAPGISDLFSYEIEKLDSSLSFRRIVFFKDHSLPDTSNVHTVRINLLIRGDIYTMNDTVILWNEQISTLELKNYNGTIAYWEEKREDHNWQKIPISTPLINNTYKYAGIYTYRALIESGDCPSEYSDSAQVVVKPNIQPNPIMDIYPNPSSNTFYVSTGTDDAFDIYVYDILGKEAWTKKGVNPNYESISVPGIKDGVYFVVLLNEDKNIKMHRKIIVKK